MALHLYPSSVRSFVPAFVLDFFFFLFDVLSLFQRSLFFKPIKYATEEIEREREFHSICFSVYLLAIEGDAMVVIKVLENLTDHIGEHEEEYRIFKDLSRHDNFPDFYGAFINNSKETNQTELWLVLEVCCFAYINRIFCFFGSLFSCFSRLRRLLIMSLSPKGSSLGS